MTDQSDNSKHDSHAGEKSWLERNVNWIIIGLVVACVATVVAQLEHLAQFESTVDGKKETSK